LTGPLVSDGATPAASVAAPSTRVVAELSCDASPDVVGDIAVDVDSARFASGPKLNPDGAFPDPNDGTGTEVDGSDDLVAPPKPKPVPNVPRPEPDEGVGRFGGAGAEVGSAALPKLNGEGATPEELALGRLASGLAVIGCDGKGFAAGAAAPLTFGAPNDG
jgi:hypothetical protein